jgi:uncharacterized damage-inducible protein DinB
VLTPAEVRAAVERAERRFGEACASATDEQWHFQPVGQGDRAWTMSQVVEHVTDANRGILRLLRDVVVTSPRGDQVPDFDDEDMPYIFYGGGRGRPPGLEEPAGSLTSKGESVAAFQASIRAILDWRESIDVDLRGCAVEHPAFGLFDGAQWLLFVAVHTQQHRGQLLDVKLASDKARATASAT